MYHIKQEISNQGLSKKKLGIILKFTLFISALVISHLANYKMILDIAITSL
jgi:hypothetical protein